MVLGELCDRHSALAFRLQELAESGEFFPGTPGALRLPVLPPTLWIAPALPALAGLSMEPAVLILIVDDEQAIADMLEVEFEEAGCAVKVVHSGEEGIAELDHDATRFRALLTDVSLGSGPTGWDVGHRPVLDQPQLDAASFHTWSKVAHFSGGARSARASDQSIHHEWCGPVLDALHQDTEAALAPVVTPRDSRGSPRSEGSAAGGALLPVRFLHLRLIHGTGLKRAQCRSDAGLKPWGLVRIDFECQEVSI